MNSHECARPGCGRQVPRNHLMCKPDWYRVPYHLREAVNATWRFGMGLTSPEYREAVRSAVEYFGTAE